MANTIQLDTSKLPSAMQREVVAKMIYDWLHEQQVTHRKMWEQRPADQKRQYYEIAQRIVDELRVKEPS